MECSQTMTSGRKVHDWAASQWQLIVKPRPLNSQINTRGSGNWPKEWKVARQTCFASLGMLALSPVKLDKGHGSAPAVTTSFCES